MNVRQCTICEAKEAGFAPRVNWRLCADCQDWDDLLHVNYCRERHEAHAALNPVLFCYKHNPDWPPSRKGGYSEFKDLTFFSAEHFARRSCILCSAVGDALERARREVETEKEGVKETKIAVWRPFILDPKKNQQNVLDESAAAEKGMVPWRQKCVLAVCIATSTTTPPTTTTGEGEEEKEEKETWSYEPGVVELMLRYEKWCYDLSEVSLWERQTMDVGQITRWLARCAHEHGDECNASWIAKSVNLPRSFRLIDVLERRVVLSPQSQSPPEYVALSYVWDAASNSPEKQKAQLYTGNIAQLEQPNSLTDDVIPEVVADAIYLCAQIGQRYLWVDRFCIVQDELELKEEHISGMGVVYDRALVTFVALGDGPTPGLTGLPCRPRQQTFHNRSWDLLPTMSNPVGEARLPLIDMALSESRWNGRAWTFQERSLSKRKIYFDAGQVYGTCYKERWQERPGDEDETEWRESGSWEMKESRERPWDFSLGTFATYSGVITPFSPRKLTFQNDVLHAFAGIVNVLETALKKPILQGHPEEYFTESLRWVPQPGFMASRRVLDNVPSWSWAAWDSKATWATDWTIAPGIYLAAGMSEVKASFVNFYVSDPKAGLRPVRERHLPLDSYLLEQKRTALKVIKGAGTSWWPSSISDDPSTVEDGEIEEMTKQVWAWAQEKAQRSDGAHAWPPSSVRTTRSERLHDLEEDPTAIAALRNLEDHIDTRWWPPTISEDPEANERLRTQSPDSVALAEKLPNSLVFNTTCAKLNIGPFGRMWFKIPPRRHLSGCVLQSADGIPVGITMAMAPQLTFDMFHKGRECLVALLGVCSVKRFMQWDKGERSRLPIHRLDEPCLLVMIMEEEDDGVCARLAVGVVYADEWVKVQPQWRTVVLA
ncbi:heterokaryon incompatibility protein-domain-containing protein [Nemania sp. FL0916]|nr:heterokaryon incompatibility protein-domain-containing protein [Nemania sp. FL0916]